MCLSVPVDTMTRPRNRRTTTFGSPQVSSHTTRAEEGSSKQCHVLRRAPFVIERLPIECGGLRSQPARGGASQL